MAMTHVFHRNPKATLNMAMHGQGIELTNQDGKNYIDASGGAAVCCLGHGHPAVIEAIKGQLDKIAYVHSSFMTTQATEDLADFLAREAPGDLKHVYFVSGGSEAIRSEEHTSELQSLMRISYAVFCLKKKKKPQYIKIRDIH